MSFLPAGFAAPCVSVAKAQPVSLTLTNSGSATLKAIQANNGSISSFSSVAAPLLSSTEYLTNGTFDSGAAGWTATNVDANGGYLNPGGNPGGFFVLNSNGLSYTDPTLTQTITGLTPGAKYLISGDFRNYDGLSLTSAPAFAIDLNGSQLTTFPIPVGNWAPFSVQFTATGVAQVLAFRAEINGTDMNSAVDNLSVRQIVECTPPATPVVTVAPPANSLYTGGVPTNLYIGYGPQSVTLIPTPQLGVTFSWTPTAGLTFPGGIATFTISNSTNPGSYTFTVTATNECGDISTSSKTITVINALCDNDKVMVCHNGHNICVSPNAVPAHLTNHGDRLGECTGTKDDKKRTTNFAVYPNPATDLATVSFRAPQDGPVRVELYNGMGLVSTIYTGNVRSGQLYSFPLNAQHLTKGIYVCRLTIDGKTEMVRLDVAQ